MNSAGFRVSEKKTKKSITISLIKLDSYVKNKKVDRVDLIKYDIEGSEKEGLIGAIETIRTYKPKLQICLYHKVEDLYEIPLMIENMFKENNYKYFLGHHHPSHWETVLYVIER